MAWLCCFKSKKPVLDDHKESKAQNDNKVTFGYNLAKGRSRRKDRLMEDFHVAQVIQVNGQELGLFGIFDGHLGVTVPLYLQGHLFNNILEEDEFWTNPHGAILNAYDRTNKEILSEETDEGGSTAVTAILINRTELWVANVGDSRAVVAADGKAVQLTVDHEPENERSDIETRGGFVTCVPGDVPRVNGILAVSRAFGNWKIMSELSCEPDINFLDVQSGYQLVILASDGVWKVMENQEAIDLVINIEDPQAAAERLVAEAISKGSRDDISCIVVRFRS